MYVLRETIKDSNKNFEYIKIENTYEFNQMKYYNSYVNKYKIFKLLFNDVIEDYDIFKESMRVDINNPRKIGNSFLNYINSLKKFEEKSKREFRKMFDYDLIKDILQKAHNNKSYNLIYNMRNYEEHISSPITTISADMNGNIKLFSNIGKIKKELKSTGWKKLLDKQFINYNIIEINEYINESYNVAQMIWKKIYECIILEDVFFIKFCARLHEFYNKYKCNYRDFMLYLCDKDNLDKLDLSNRVDILFIKGILLSKILHVTNVEFKIGETIVDNDIKYVNVSKEVDMINKKIVDQCFVPACLDERDIKFILDRVKK